MHITIDLGAEYSEGTVENQILDRAATKIADSVERDVRSALTVQIRGVAEDELRKLMRPMLSDAMTTLLQPTDSFGGPRGEAKTLRQVIVEIAEKELRKPSDRYDSRNPSVLQKLIREEVQRTIRGELQIAMKDARAAVLEAVQAEGGKIVAETIAKIARV